MGLPQILTDAVIDPAGNVWAANNWNDLNAVSSPNPIRATSTWGGGSGFNVIYGVAAMPFVERLAKSARRTFIGDRVWSARVELDELYAKNDLQHRAIRDAIAAGSSAGARLLAREHVLSSGRLLEIVIESLGGSGPDPEW